MSNLLTYETVEKDLSLHVGAMEPWRFQVREGGAGGTLTSFTGDEVLRLTYGLSASTIDLTDGDGLEYEDAEGVTDARIIARLTNAQSRLLPNGSLTKYELQTGDGATERVIIMGRVKVKGGLNPDG